jgi:predicted XRE-type DNA-binding protein
MKKIKPIVGRDAGALARILGLPSSIAPEWEARSALTDKIIELAKREKVTHASLAKRTGTSRTRITSILNHNIAHVSTDLLIRILAALGYKVTFTVARAKLAA